MAVTVSAVEVSSSVYSRSFTVIATADADTTATITHGLPNITNGDTQIQIVIEPLIAAAQLSLWTVTSKTATSNTQITLTKATTAGSGNASAQIRVWCHQVHSIER